MTRSLTSLSSTVLLLLLLLLVSGLSLPAEANQPQSPFMGFCRHRLDEFDWRYVLYYQQALLSSGPGKDLIGLLRQAVDGEGKVKSDDELAERIHKMLKIETIEKERRNLQRRSQNAFDCVSAFEHEAAGNFPQEDWMKPFDPKSLDVAHDAPHHERHGTTVHEEYDSLPDMDWDDLDHHKMHPEEFHG